jgi:site-specific recombinase XerD
MTDLLPPNGDPNPQKDLQTRVDRAASRNPAVSYLASLGSASSRRVQRAALDKVARLLSNGEIEDCLDFPWENLDYGTVTAVKAWLEDRYAPATVNRHLVAIRRVIKEAWRHHLITAEAYQRATDVQSVNAQRLPTGRELESVELSELIAVCLEDESNPALGIRDAAIISLMYSSGLRRAEVVALNLEDLDLTKGQLRVVGKRNKERLAFLAQGAVRAVEKWLDLRGKLPGPLFYPVNKSGKVVRSRKERLTPAQKSAGRKAQWVEARLTDQTIYHVINRRALEAGLVKKTTPHDLRRTFVSDLLEAGVDLSTVSKMAGHEDTNTTRRYDRRPDKVMQEAAEKLDVPFPDEK